MKVDLNQPIKNIETDQPFVDESGKPLTIGKVLRLALNNEPKPEKKEAAYIMLKRLIDADKEHVPLRVKSDEVTHLKELVKLGFQVPVAGWVCEYLEGDLDGEVLSE